MENFIRIKAHRNKPAPNWEKTTAASAPCYTNPHSHCVLTGSKSNIIVIRVDFKALDVWTKLTKDINCETYTVIAPDGSKYLYFSWKKKYEKWSPKGGILGSSFITLIGNNGYVIGDGSRFFSCYDKTCPRYSNKKSCTHKRETYTNNDIKIVALMPTELEDTISREFCANPSVHNASDSIITFWHQTGLSTCVSEKGELKKLYMVLNYLGASPSEILKISKEIIGNETHSDESMSEISSRRVWQTLDFDCIDFLTKYCTITAYRFWARLLVNTRTDVEYIICCILNPGFIETSHYCHIIYIYLKNKIVVDDDFQFHYYCYERQLYRKMPPETSYQGIFIKLLQQTNNSSLILDLFPELLDGTILPKVLKFINQEKWKTVSRADVPIAKGEFPLKGGYMIDVINFTKRKRNTCDYVTAEINSKFLNEFQKVCIWGTECPCKLPKTQGGSPDIEALFPQAFRRIAVSTSRNKEYLKAFIIHLGYFLLGNTYGGSFGESLTKEVNKKTLLFKICEEILGPYLYFQGAEGAEGAEGGAEFVNDWFDDNNIEMSSINNNTRKDNLLSFWREYYPQFITLFLYCAHLRHWREKNNLTSLDNPINGVGYLTINQQ